MDRSCVSLNEPWLFQKVAHSSKAAVEQERSRLMFCTSLSFLFFSFGPIGQIMENG